jgi:glycosyltransferase involved in cell wall biosynthesis
LNITILICTFNGKSKLGDTLSHIASLEKPEEAESIEIVLVDNGSDDGTSEFVLECWGRLNTDVPLKILNEEKPGKSNALTTGYNNSKGDVIVLCDDDNWLDRDYLIYVHKLFNTYPEIGLAGGYGKSAVFTDGNEPEWFDRFKWSFMVGTHHRKSGFLSKNDYSIYGAGSVLRKEVWNKLVNAGFRFQNFRSKGRTMAEDVELAMAVFFSGYKLYFDSNLKFIHDLRWGRLTWSKFVEQTKMNGKSHVFPDVYEIIYHRIATRYLFIRFVKYYILHILDVRKKANILSKKVNVKEYEIELIKNKNLYTSLIFSFPELILKYHLIKNWIKNLHNTAIKF